MITSILKTDGGPHPVEKWAEATANHIIQIGEHLSGAELTRARRFELTIMDILEGHHGTIQSGERQQIQHVGNDRLLHDCDCEHHICVEEAVDEIIEASKNTVFETHFANPEVKTYLINLLNQHFNTSMFVERAWHADKNPNTVQAKEFKAKWGHGPREECVDSEHTHEPVVEHKSKKAKE